MLQSIYRTHTCHELREGDLGKIVTLSGWVHVKRDHGGLVFIDLRDNYGITQVVVDAARSNLKPDQVDKIPLESVVTIIGTVVLREEQTIRKDIATGVIEILADNIVTQSTSAVLPLQVNKDTDFNEDLRLTYRFLDLRRKKMHDVILLRSRIIHWIRNKMVECGFYEFQTPILTSSSPEGARDFLVPSRLHPGKFYALPQAPQQFKQLLMVAGFDRYFQIAPCFRDEDARADRSPGEFYQLDIEMSFVEQNDVLNAIEPIIKELFQTFSDKVMDEAPFIRISYQEAMAKYGTDKPDLRNPLVNSDVTDAFRNSNFTIFSKAIAAGDTVVAIVAPKTYDRPRSFFDNMILFAKEHGALGLAYITFDKDYIAGGPIAKLLRKRELDSIREITNISSGDTVFFCCDKLTKVNKIASMVRTHLGEKLDLLEDNVFKFCWIVDFPYFEWDDKAQKIDFSHNPFSMPQGGLEALATSSKDELLSIKAWQYDLVCNGVELSSGAIRNHLPEIMYRAFEIAGYDRAVVENRFGAMLQAFRFGAPPHGGLAPGLDRMIMLLCDVSSIREVVAFPVNGNAEDLLMKAPSEVSQHQLDDLYIKHIKI